jgi:hypothetical protein
VVEWLINTSCGIRSATIVGFKFGSGRILWSKIR